jgi:hypothetical protein
MLGWLYSAALILYAEPTITFFLLLALTSISLGFNESASDKSIRVGIIKKPLTSWGDCNLQFPKDYKKRNDSYVFMNYEQGGLAQININGKDLILKLAGRTKSEFEMKAGYHHFEEYASGGARVRVDYVVIDPCDPNNEQCEVFVESAVITINHKGRVKRIKTIGLCGS